MEDNSNISIGRRVKALREHRHLTQRELGELTHSTEKHISEIERGKTGMSIESQIQLSNVLHCSIDYLVKGENFSSVDYFFPDEILEIIRSSDKSAQQTLLDYLNIFLRIKNNQ